MNNSRALNTMVPSKTCRNDVYMVILVPEEIRVEYAIAYLRNKEIFGFILFSSTILTMAAAEPP